MASRIQGITVEIGGDTTKLQTALKGVNGQIKQIIRQLYTELYKEKNITKFRNTKISVERKVVV